MYSYGTATKWVKQSIHVICVKELVNSLVSNCLCVKAWELLKSIETKVLILKAKQMKLR